MVSHSIFLYNSQLQRDHKLTHSSFFLSEGLYFWSTILLTVAKDAGIILFIQQYKIIWANVGQ